MKKLFLIFILFFIYNSTNAVYVENKEPIFDDINHYLLNSDIEPGYNPQPADRIGVLEQYIADGVDLYTAEKYCSLKGQLLINYTLEASKTNIETALYYPLLDTWWNYGINIVRFAVITCDDNTPVEETATGTYIVNNFSDEDQGINKKVFDIETITEIYKLEGIIMVFIVFGTFIARVLGIRNKKRPLDL